MWKSTLRNSIDKSGPRGAETVNGSPAWRRTHLLWLTAWLVLLVATPQAQQAGRPIDELKFPPLQFSPRQASERSLSNGLTVFLLEDHELPIVSAFAMLRTGGRYEPEPQLGLASLTGTVLRSGGTQTLSPNQLNEKLEFISASLETSIGDSAGFASLSALSKDLETGLDLLSQVLRQPAFDPQQIDLAKDRVRESIRRRNDFPGSIASREFSKRLYGERHPLARTVELEHLERIDREDLLNFHARFYHPNNLTLGVAGDFESNRLMELLEKYFGDWPAQPVPTEPAAQDLTGPKPQIFYIFKNVNQVNLRIGHLGIRRQNPDFFAVTVMDSVLGRGFSSRLFREVRSRLGLAYSVASNYGAGFRDRGLFTISLESKSESTAEAVQAVIAQVEKLRSQQVEPEELAIAQESVLNRFVFAFDSPGEIVNRQVRYRFFDLPPDYLMTYRDRVAEVSFQDVARVARQYLHPERLVILAVGPEQTRSQLAQLGEVKEIPLKD